MMNSEYILDLSNVFHTGQVEPGTCLQRLIGSVRTGVILKDVSMEIHGGEVMAILGSKGSGKRALLEVISRRAQGPTRGQILLNGIPMSLRLFQESCAYVTQKCDLIPGLTVQQTLNYAANLTVGSKVSRYVKRSRVKQVMCDLALTQVANRCVEDLTQSEYRRVMIGVQLIRDPVVLLLDEPTWDLDPLNTYFVVSILSNHAKKYNRIVVLTMEKPRSDIFPFLDRVTYLCLGDIVYTGSTRMMLDYFRNIGFPCPELENPLMYYLCLSTVDRRSRERFIESNQQIAALVEKFKLEGGPFRKSAGPVLEADPIAAHQKVPLSAFGHPGTFQVMFTLIARMFAATFNFRKVGLAGLILRLFAFPIFFFLLWVFYSGMENYQRTFVTRNGLIFNCLAGAYFVSICIASSTFSNFRTRYYQEAQEGLYGGPLFLISYTIFSVPFSILSMAAASRIAYQLTDTGDPMDWFIFGSLLWACALLAEHQTIALLTVIKSSFSAANCSIYLTIIYLVLSSGTLRSLRGLPEWLLYFSYITQPRYAGAFLNEQMFEGKLSHLPRDVHNNCTGTSDTFGCRYADGTSYLAERYHTSPSDIYENELQLYFNLGISFAFGGGMVLLNCLLYLVPLPAFVKAKFRE